ncbi:hypothetical protein [Agaribacterium sp. ZY112]|uniref:hypothetical protein n=1 Tax=Agaribacterium sp. ZY112 TaxID=3233574 RepID=UPI0035254B64
MKEALRKLCAPVLNLFENGQGSYSYKPSHRSILIAVGVLFSILATSIFVVGLMSARPGALLPGLVFSAAGLCCLIVGGLGSDRAVAKLWGNK